MVAPMGKLRSREDAMVHRAEVDRRGDVFEVRVWVWIRSQGALRCVTFPCRPDQEQLLVSAVESALGRPFDQLTAAPCYALFSMPGRIDFPEGLEGLSTGLRVTLTGWQAANGLGKTNRQLMERRVAIERAIVEAEQAGDHRVLELKAEADALETSFVDWGFGCF